MLARRSTTQATDALGSCEAAKCKTTRFRDRLSLPKGVFSLNDFVFVVRTPLSRTGLIYVVTQQTKEIYIKLLQYDEVLSYYT